MSSGKFWPFFLDLSVLNGIQIETVGGLEHACVYTKRVYLDILCKMNVSVCRTYPNLLLYF